MVYIARHQYNEISGFGPKLNDLDDRSLDPVVLIAKCYCIEYIALLYTSYALKVQHTTLSHRQCVHSLVTHDVEK